MRLSMALKEKLMDVRLRDKLLAEGKVTKAELDQYLQSVKDDSANAEDVNKERQNQQ